MLLPVIDALRCPARHEESPLVLAADSWRDGRIWDGRLGCSRCGTQYVIRAGVADFSGQGAEVVLLAAPVRDDAATLRLGAQSGITEPGGLVLLGGRYALFGEQLAALLEVTCVLVHSAVSAGPGTAVLRAPPDWLPISSGSVRFAAVEGEWVAEAARVLGAGGRLVGPPGSPVPPAFRLLATDDVDWVAEAPAAPPPLVAIGRN